MANFQVYSFYIIYISASFVVNANTPTKILGHQAINKTGSNNKNYFDGYEINTLKLKVYYETLCPASVDFFTKHLQPAVEALGSNLEVTMFPYGNAETKIFHGTYKFTCQHGPAECYGNKLHACAIDVIKNNTKAVLYNSCLMKYCVKREDYSIDFTTALNWCGYKYKVPIRKVWNCAHSRRGSNLLRHFGQATQKLGIKYVPYVLLEGSSDMQDKATAYFMTTICQMLEYPPPVCEIYMHSYRRSYKKFN